MSSAWDYEANACSSDGKFSAKFGSTKIDVTSEIKKLTREYYSRAARFKRHMTKAAMENIQKTHKNIGNKINSITKPKK